jgi:hypothetical protein
MLALAILSHHAEALAEHPDRPELIERAQQAKASGDHAEALRLGRRAGEEKMTASLRRFLVEEESALGMWVDAYSDAQKCRSEAALEPPSANHDAVLIGCRTLLHELRDHVGLLVFDFPLPPPADLRVTIDGRLVDNLLGEPEHATSLGDVVIEAAAPGRASLRRTVRAGTELTHVVLAFAEPPHDPVASPATPDVAPRSGEPVSVRTVRGPSGPIVAGVGLAAGIGAIVMRAVATGQYNALVDRCRTQGCSDGPEVRARIERLDTIALVSGVGGAALLGLGATLYFVVDKRSEPVLPPQRSSFLSLGVDPRSPTVTLGGVF